MTDDNEPQWLDDDEMAAWLSLIAVIYKLPQALDQQLRREVGISHTYYSMLATLSAQPDHTLSMGDLARLTFTSPSRLTHAVDSLEKRGWVTRRPCPTNRRVQYATLTEEGVETLRRTAPFHVAEVRRRVFDRLTREQVHQLRDVARALSEGFGEDAPGDVPGDVSGATSGQ